MSKEMSIPLNSKDLNGVKWTLRDAVLSSIIIWGIVAGYYFFTKKYIYHNLWLQIRWEICSAVLLIGVPSLIIRRYKSNLFEINWRSENVIKDIFFTLVALSISLCIGKIYPFIYESVTGKQYIGFLQRNFLSYSIAPLWYIIVTSFFTVIIFPIAEEIFFRGFLYPPLRQKFGRILGIIFQSLVFAIYHWLLPLPNITLIFVQGIILGYIFQIRKNLLAPVLLHIGYNMCFTISVIIFLLSPVPHKIRDINYLQKSTKEADIIRLVNYLKDDNDLVQGHAIASLMLGKKKEAVPFLLTMLRSGDDYDMATAMTLLSVIADKTLASEIAKALDDESWKVRYSTLRVLWRIKAIAEIGKALDDKDERVRNGAERFLRKLTGMDFGYREKIPEEQKKEAINRWKKWLEESKNLLE